MPTLVLPPRYTPESIAMWHAAGDAGWDVERLPNWKSASTLAGKDVVLYGEPLFALAVADALNLALLGPPPDWLPKLPDDYRRRTIRLMSLAEAGAVNGPVFIKPAEDKCFQARVYASGSELPLPSTLPASTPVLVAEPVCWEVEYRCFVLEQEVVTFSPYAPNEQLAQAEDGSWPATDAEQTEALTFAAQVLSDPRVRVPPAVVLDVGRISDRGWAVIEANAAWGSGIYGCDPRQVLRVVQRSCVRWDKLSPAEEAFCVVP